MFKILTQLYQIFPGQLFSKVKYISFLLLISTFLEMMSIGVLLSLIVTIFGESLAFTKNLMDFLSNLLHVNDPKKIKFIILIFVLIFFISKNVILYLILLYKNKFVFGINQILSEKLFGKYLNSKFDFFFKNNLSTITRTIEVDSLSVTKLSFALITIITEILIIFGMAILLLFVNFEVSIIILCLGVLLSLIYYVFIYKKVTKWGNLRQIYTAQRFKIIQETILGIKDIFIHQAEHFFFEKFKNTNKSVVSVIRKDNNLLNFPRYLFEIFIISLILLTIFILLNNNYSNEETILTLTILITSASRVYPAFTRLIAALQTIKFNKPALDKIFDELVRNKNNTDNGKIIDKDITLKDPIEKLEIINFNYAYAGKIKILENVNLEFKKNNIYGIVGESGSGKTTILNFICGLLSSENCEILLNEKKSNHKEFVRKIGYVPQHVFLLDDSIKHNIALGIKDEEINSNKIDKILKDLKLNNFLSNKKIDIEDKSVYLGDSGNKVSGGQRQRIGIARAFYFESEILIFDETTSALDSENEKKIIDIIKNNKKNKIIIIVSHNENMTNICDKIFEIKDKTVQIKK
jgi:ABC-type bacteriocin/lantibiotic exporter with double-glycine peptidase domain